MFESASEFSLYIETFARENEIDLVDSILLYCEDNYLEPHEIASLINKSLKDKLEVEFSDMNYLPKFSSLVF
jgi:hypothetical protein